MENRYYDTICKACPISEIFSVDREYDAELVEGDDVLLDVSSSDDGVLEWHCTRLVEEGLQV